MPPGRYLLGDTPVDVSTDGLPRNAAGTIAGSTLTLDCAVRNSVRVGVPAAAALEAASRVPADVLGRADLGRIAAGARADLVWWSEDLHPLRTWVDAHAQRSPGLLGVDERVQRVEQVLYGGQRVLQLDCRLHHSERAVDAGERLVQRRRALLPVALDGGMPPGRHLCGCVGQRQPQRLGADVRRDRHRPRRARDAADHRPLREVDVGRTAAERVVRRLQVRRQRAPAAGRERHAADRRRLLCSMCEGVSAGRSG
jgi:hypothetical protein